MNPWFLFWLIPLLIRLVIRFVYPRRRRQRMFGQYREIFRDIIGQHGGYLQELGRHTLLYTSHNGLQQVEFRGGHESRISFHARTSFDFQVNFTPIHTLPYAFIGEFYSTDSRVEPFFISSPKTATAILAKPGAKTLLEKFGQDGFSIRFGADGITVSRSMRRRSATEFEIVEWMRKLDDLVRICNAVEAGKVHPVESDRHCGYCKEQIQENDRIMYCASCSTPHHEECFQLNGKCTVFGCGSQQASERQAPLSAFARIG